MKAGWQVKKLRELGITQTGTTPKTSVKEYFGNYIPFIKPADFNDDGTLNCKNEGLSAAGSKKSRCVKAGSVMMVCIGTIGKCGFCEQEVTMNQQINSLTPFAGFDYKFIYYQMLTEKFRQQALLNSGQTTLPILNKSKWNELPLLLPPLPEQQRIVAILDEAFDGIAVAKANAEQNRQNARELFDSYLQSVFMQRGEGWVEKKLGEIYDVRDGTHDSPVYQTDGFPLITSKNLKRFGLNFDDVKYISEKDFKKINERSVVHRGDILFAMIGTIGNPVVVDVEPQFAIKNVALFKVSDRHNSFFLKYYLDSQFVRSKMMDEAKGTTQKFVGLGYLREFPINIPPLSKQHFIVARLDDLSTETQRLESLYQQKIAALDELKQSLLHRAFAGEL